MTVLPWPAFFASLIHVPIGPVNAHLILNGLVGLLLGWAAFPVILVALVLQAMLFQFGGITALGVNTLIMALPAVLCYLIFSPFLNKNSTLALSTAFACGFLSVFLSALCLGLALVFTEKNFFEISAIVIAAHIPVMIVEGIVTAICVAFLKKVHPTMLPGSSKQ
jgi:cobalt/nickel transport system permease protein